MQGTDTLTRGVRLVGSEEGAERGRARTQDHILPSRGGETVLATRELLRHRISVGQWHMRTIRKWRSTD